MKTTRDLFEYHELIPQNVKTLLEEYEEQAMEGFDYNTLAEITHRLNELGYNMSYGLDAIPYNLHQMKFCKP